MDRTKTDLKKFHFIYRTTNLLNGRYYVGLHSTDNVDDDYIGSGVRLWNEVNKYGREKFKREILEYLPSRHELKARERSLVNEDMLKDPLCMNLKLGGEGGWDHVTYEQQLQCQAIGASLGGKASMKKHGTARGKRLCAQLSEERKQGLRKYPFADKSHSEETKRKMSETRCGTGTGSSNSQHGTCWVCNEDGPKKIKLEALQFHLDAGYWRGRKKMNVHTQ